ncbi:unnamed protein product [Blepharisma stoltei]|uniref:Kelch motif family protein n=1 Tax=Blepharisma stoltei TaxID=1481888 RepID=A0AAU9JQL7_9CILI|nr:unnamed protein product [Blepharisma stoltei]
MIKLIHGDGDHYSKIHKRTRKAAIKQLFKIKSDLKRYKSKIIQEDLSLIKQIQSTAQETLKLLHFQDRELSDIILKVQNLKRIDNSKEATFIESMLKLSPVDLSKIQSIKSPELHIRHIDSKYIQQLFELDELSEENILIDMNYQNESHIIKFIQTISNSIVIFDAEALTYDKLKLPGELCFDQYGATCLLPDGKFFYSNLTSTVLIDADDSVKHLPDCLTRNLNASAIYKDGYIYVFGGSYNTSAKYSIAKNIWTPLSKLPRSIGQHASCFIFKNYILIGSTKTSQIFYYDIIIDSFNEISFSNISSWIPKIFFVVNETLYFADFSNKQYKISDNLVTWKEIEDNSFTLNSTTPIISTPIIYNQKYYYTNYRIILTFDLKKKRIEELKNIF